MVRNPGQTKTGLGLAQALDLATQGNDLPLFNLLTRGSRLPGVRANLALALAFAEECAARGGVADALILRMATLHADAAPGATELEFLPVCGVMALGARGAKDAAVQTLALATLHDCAEDLRWRVRDAVPDALARIGEAGGDAVVAAVAPWMNGFFQASAVLRAAGQPRWLSRVTQADGMLARLDEAFSLARDADRATERYPGYKALVEALSSAAAPIAARFGPRTFDLLVLWAKVKEPMLRTAIEANLTSRLTRRFGEDVARVRKALAESAPTRRDPTTYVGPTRGRGRKKSRESG
jgi:hypothetical protein